MEEQKASQFRPGSVKGRKVNKAGAHQNIVALFKAFMGGPASVRQLSEKTGIFYDTLSVLIKALHQGGVIYIDSWAVDTMGRPVIARYAYGYGVDAIRPKKKTTAERSMKHKRKKERMQEEPLKTIGLPKVANDAIDNVFRMWGHAA